MAPRRKLRILTALMVVAAAVSLASASSFEINIRDIHRHSHVKLAMHKPQLKHQRRLDSHTSHSGFVNHRRDAVTGLLDNEPSHTSSSSPSHSKAPPGPSVNTNTPSVYNPPSINNSGKSSAPSPIGSPSVSTTNSPSPSSQPVSNLATPPAVNQGAVVSSNSIQPATQTSPAVVVVAAAASSVSSSSMTPIPVVTAVVTETMAKAPSAEPSSTSESLAASQGSQSSTNDSTSSTKVIVPIVVVAGCLALTAVAWTVFQKAKRSKREEYDPRMQPIDFAPSSSTLSPLSSSHPSLLNSTPTSSALAMGGASDGYVRRQSYESFEAGRPLSVASHHHNQQLYSNNNSPMIPPMQEVLSTSPYFSNSNSNSSGGGGVVGRLASDSSRIPNYPFVSISNENQVRYDQEFHHDNEEAYDAVTNYYDGSSNLGYTNPAARGIDVAGTLQATSISHFSPYKDVQRSN